jgi:exonuclease VII small subunit
MDEKRFRDLETDVVIIKRDMSQYGTLFAKMDLTIDKITDLSNKTNQLLAVHEERLDYLQGVDKDLERKYEKTLEELKTIVAKLDSMHVYLIGEITNNDVKMREEIKSLNKQLAEELKKRDGELADLSSQMKTLERWKWIVIGFSLAAGWIIDKIPLAVGIGS